MSQLKTAQLRRIALRLVDEDLDFATEYGAEAMLSLLSDDFQHLVIGWMLEDPEATVAEIRKIRAEHKATAGRISAFLAGLNDRSK